MPVIIDFHLRPHDKKGSYSLQIFQRGSSQPLHQAIFDYDLSYITQFEINRLEPDEKDPSARLDRIRDFGGKLYKKLFTPDVQKLWAGFIRKADFLVLCLRIDPQASELETLPWETLHNGDEFLAAGATTGISRLPLDITIQDNLPPLPIPVKMLALLSSPLDLKDNERLNIEREQEILLQAVNSPAGQGRLSLEFEDEAKLPVIESCLENPCHILHYSGHGIPPENGGGLLLEDSQGNQSPASVTEVFQTLQKAGKTLRLVVLSGCQTARTLNITGFRHLANDLLRNNVPAVIAMQFSILDSAGTLFAESLYPRLIEGRCPDMALNSARRALLHSDDPHIRADAFAPVLFLSADQPLRIKPEEKPAGPAQPKIDFTFYLPLPQLAFGFYGRRKEYRAIRDGLLYKNHRVVIVYGIGGIGKTALISHTANRLHKNFRGVYAFDCSGATLAPETVLLQLHRYLEQQQIHSLEQLLHRSIPPNQLATFLAQVLGQIPLLIIFDNFESQLAVKNGAHHIADENLDIFLKTLIKTTSQSTRFLFTTRYLFDIDAKRIGNICELPLGDLSRPEAIGLMQKLPHLSKVSHNDKLRVFDTFGGHPYALVTLDRHCGHKPLAQVLADAAAVHTELRQFLAIELNYNSLSGRARLLLNRLAAFRKPVEVDAAEWVIGEKNDEETVARDFFKDPDINPEIKKLGEEEFIKKYKTHLPQQRHAENIDKPIDELISWGLLTPVEEDGQTRLLAVHSLVRDFCRDKQKGESWNNSLKDAAAYYTNYTKLLRRDEKSPAVVWAEMEAFELLFEAQAFEDAASLLIKATHLLDRWGFGRYLESLHHRIIPKVQRAAQSALLHNLGILHQDRGDYDAALSCYEKSQKIFEVLGNRRGIASSLHQTGKIHQARGDYHAALDCYEKSLKIDEELGDRNGIAGSLFQIGVIHQDRGDYPAALAHYEKSLKISEELGDQASISLSLHQIGTIHQDRGDYPTALAHYEKSLKIKEKLDDREGIAGLLHNIGVIHQDHGDYPTAMVCYEKSLKIFEELGNRAGISLSHAQIGRLFTETKRYPEAFENFLLAILIFDQLQSPNAGTVLAYLKNLRKLWGEENFDNTWRTKTGQDVPDQLKDTGKNPDTQK